MNKYAGHCGLRGLKLLMALNLEGRSENIAAAKIIDRGLLLCNAHVYTWQAAHFKHLSRPL